MLAAHQGQNSVRGRPWRADSAITSTPARSTRFAGAASFTTWVMEAMLLPVELTPRTLNRTLLDRQHLLARSSLPAVGLVAHLVGLQAQETMPPYLSLSARLADFDPLPVSDAIGDGGLARMVVMRGTIHLLTPDDALSLRQFSQPVQDRERRSSQNTRPALHLATASFN